MNAPPPTEEAKAMQHLVRLFVAITLVAIVGAVVQPVVLDQREIDEMPAPERRALFDSALATFRTLCEGAAPEALQRRCGDDAAYLTRFPECDEACRFELRQFHGRATR